MNPTLEEVIAAGVAGERIDPSYSPNSIRFLFKEGVESFDSDAFERLQLFAKEEFGVSLDVTGGGAGCFRIICEGDPPEEFARLLTSRKFIEMMGDLRIDVVSSKDLTVPVKKHLEESESRADFSICLLYTSPSPRD